MLSRMRILLAEDERTISRLIKQVLSSAGHDVIGVQSCSEAIELLQGEPFDLVLLDLNLSDGDGFRVVEALQERTEVPPPVLLMTGEHAFDDSDPRTGRVAGILWKPFNVDELEQAVNRFIA
jgi:DNA-binding response OmpR family regulator